MANRFLTNDEITQEALAIFHEKTTFLRSINTEYDSKFARNGAKIGDTLRVREPIDPQVFDGARLNTIPDVQERNRQITVDIRKHTVMKWSMHDRTLDMDNFSPRYIEPHVSNLVANIEAEVIKRATQATFNSVGTPGNPLNALSVPLAARTKINQWLGPKDGRSIMLSSASSATMVDALKGLFNHQAEVGKQYREGHMGRAIGFDWTESESVHSHTNGTATNGAVNATVAVNGTDTIVLKGVGATNTVTKGSVFTIAGVKNIHPQTKVPRPELQQFVVKEDAVAAGGVVTLKVFPEIYFQNAPYKNVSQTPTVDAVVTWVGAPGQTYEQSLAFVKNAFTFVSVDLAMPESAKGSRKNFEGVSLRMVQQYDIVEDEETFRLDFLGGFAPIREHWAARLWGTQV